MNRFVVITVIILLNNIGCIAQKPDMTILANAFLKSLDKNQQLKVSFPFEEEEPRSGNGSDEILPQQ